MPTVVPIHHSTERHYIFLALPEPGPTKKYIPLSSSDYFLRESLGSVFFLSNFNLIVLL